MRRDNDKARDAGGTPFPNTKGNLFASAYFFSSLVPCSPSFIALLKFLILVAHHRHPAVAPRPKAAVLLKPGASAPGKGHGITTKPATRAARPPQYKKARPMHALLKLFASGLLLLFARPCSPPSITLSKFLLPVSHHRRPA
jgi:hypothetical protein